MRWQDIQFVEVEQPDSWQMVLTDDIFVKQMVLAKAGYTVSQHVHEYDHHTMLAAGAVAAWVGNAEHPIEFSAPYPIFVAAGTPHKFMALEDNTILYCIHNLHGKGAVSILAAGEQLVR